MNRKKLIVLLFWFLFLVGSAEGTLRIDFGPTEGPVAAGYQGYRATHASSLSFTGQDYQAFGVTVRVTPLWPNQPDPSARQMVQRQTGSDLLVDWIGTDARVPNAEPLILEIRGLPAGSYAWRSFHHDTLDLTTTFYAVVVDADGLRNITDLRISSGARTPWEEVERFETVITSNGRDPVRMGFACQPDPGVSSSLFLMNGLVLSDLSSSSVSGDIDGDGRVDALDLWSLARRWLSTAACVPDRPCTDLDGDGRTALADFAALAVRWRRDTATVVINEFVASNRESFTDGDGYTPDWIELYNHGSEPISLRNWSLTDNPDDLDKWTFPDDAVLHAGSYLVVCASGKKSDRYVDPAGFLHTNFALNRDGEYLALVRDGKRVVHDIAPDYPPQQVDISYGLWNSQLRYFAEPTPGRANAQAFPGYTEQTTHSRERGLYDAPFELRIHSAAHEALIRYTLDGSEPTEQHGQFYQAGMSILIADSTVVRSIAFKPGWRPAPVTTHTYILVDQVARQSATPAGWPSDWGYSSDAKAVVPADYEMDPRVVDNTEPGYSLREALLDIPSMSIAMHPDDFISEGRGIYAHPQSRWERPCSVEYIWPPGAAGFQYPCKIEIHGNASRRPYRMQKHSFRLTFTREYGPAKLNYPLFPGSPVESFNQLVLRACFTDSWGLVSWSSSRYRPHDSQYLRDVWMKDSFRDMGHPSSYGSFVHLYVNGLYFGLFNLTERVGEDFFASHLGGEPEDWEVNEDLSHPGPHWKEMMSLNPGTSDGYQQMQAYLDVENFADYMLLHFYADAEDWPHHNGYAAANIASGDGKFRFFVWDQEIVLDSHGRAASRINRSQGAGELFQKLRASTAFRQLFAERVDRHCFAGGALSVTASQERYRLLARSIDKAIVAESARWGDTQVRTPYGNTVGQPTPLDDINHDLYPPAPHGPDFTFTREASWVIERDNIIENYIPSIHDTRNAHALVNLLRRENLYPEAKDTTVPR